MLVVGGDVSDVVVPTGCHIYPQSGRQYVRLAGQRAGCVIK